MKVSTALFLVVLTFAGSAAAQPPGRPAAGSRPAGSSTTGCSAHRTTARARQASSSSFLELGSAARTGRTPRLPGATFSASARSRSWLPRRPPRAASATGLAGGVPCTGDGVTGKRVQAVYAYQPGRGDNYDEIAPFIRLWAGVVDETFNDSAAETGGVRHVRFVTDPDCTLDVAKVELSPAGVSSLAGTAADLAAQGFDRPDRKYLVWVDAYVFCGVATVKPDDRPSPGQREQRGRPAGHGGAGRSRLLGRRQPLDRGARARPSSRRRAAERSERERQLPLHGRRRGPLLRRRRRPRWARLGPRPPGSPQVGVRPGPRDGSSTAGTTTTSTRTRPPEAISRITGTSRRAAS